MNVINICEFVDSSKWKRNIWKFIVEDLLLTEKNQEVKRLNQIIIAKSIIVL